MCFSQPIESGCLQKNNMREARLLMEKSCVECCRLKSCLFPPCRGGTLGLTHANQASSLALSHTPSPVEVFLDLL